MWVEKGTVGMAQGSCRVVLLKVGCVRGGAGLPRLTPVMGWMPLPSVVEWDCLPHGSGEVLHSCLRGQR